MNSSVLVGPLSALEIGHPITIRIAIMNATIMMMIEAIAPSGKYAGIVVV